MEGLPCRGDRTGNGGRCTLGPPDPEATPRQHPRINSFVNEELGRDMIEVTRALQGSSSAQLRPRRKRNSRRTTDAEEKKAKVVNGAAVNKSENLAAVEPDNTEDDDDYTTRARGWITEFSTSPRGGG